MAGWLDRPFQWSGARAAGAVALAVSLLPASATAQGQAADSGAAASPPGSLLSPAQESRPRIRYWLPSALVEEEALRADVRRFARQGFGGFEMVAMASSTPADAPADRLWGTDKWDAAVRVALDEAGKHGLSVSITNGPQWPIAMPGVTSADHPGSLYELTHGVATVEAGETYSGPLPARRTARAEGTPRLVAVLAYEMLDEQTLDPTSVRDLTASVVRNDDDEPASTVTFTAPAGDRSWALFSFVEQPAVQKVQGLYVIDHMSAAGTATSTRYWDNALKELGPAAAPLEAIFNDSLEYAVTMEWTRGLRAEFQEDHGYDITPYLPFVGVAETFPENQVPGFRAGDGVTAERANRDYVATVTRLYNENHLQPLQLMAERHGIDISYQQAYNKPFQVETSAASVGIPETEGLGRNTLDNMRQSAGAVHLLGKDQLSFEAAAEFINGYGQTTEDIAWWNKRAWAAGVTRQTLHGTSYSGEYAGPGNEDGFVPGAAWPGYNGFVQSPPGVVSNEWTRTTSEDSMRDLTDYLARTNEIMQKPAKVDVAVYQNDLQVHNDPSTTYGDGQVYLPDGGLLNSYGYSYDLLSLALLERREAVVEAGRLAPEGPGYRALLVPEQESITLAAVDRLRRLAQQGLRVVLVGDLPTRTGSLAEVRQGVTDQRLAEAVRDLLRLPQVSRVGNYSELPALLQRVGVRPAADYGTPVDVLAQRRIDSTGDYYYMYNYNKVSGADAEATVTASIASTDRTSEPLLDRSKLTAKSVDLTLTGRGAPYVVDAWSGRVTPVPVYSRDGERIRLQLELLPDEAAILALLTPAQARAAGATPLRIHATSVTPGGRLVPVDGGLVLQAEQDGEYVTTLADGRRIVTPVKGLPGTSAVLDWSLTVDSVARPLDGAKSFDRSRRERLGPLPLGPALRPWRTIPTLANVSGLGRYEGTFDLASLQGRSAVLDLGEVEGMYRIWINGMRVPADQVDTRIDLGPLAVAGRNSVRVDVASTMWNAVLVPTKDYGLLGRAGLVQVRPAARIPLVTDKTSRGAAVGPAAPATAPASASAPAALPVAAQSLPATGSSAIQAPAAGAGALLLWAVWCWRRRPI